MTAVSSRFEITRHEKYAYSDRYAGAERMVSRFKFKTLKDVLLSCREDWTDSVLDRIDNEAAATDERSRIIDELSIARDSYATAMSIFRQRWPSRIHQEYRRSIRRRLRHLREIRQRVKTAERTLSALIVGDTNHIRPAPGNPRQSTDPDYPSPEAWGRYFAKKAPILGSWLGSDAVPLQLAQRESHPKFAYFAPVPQPSAPVRIPPTIQPTPLQEYQRNAASIKRRWCMREVPATRSVLRMLITAAKFNRGQIPILPN